MGEVLSIEDDGFARRLRVALAPELLRYAVEKGSIALNGVSLTVADLGDVLGRGLADSRDPGADEPWRRSPPGDKLNVECDVVAKYVERLMTPFAGKERA